MATGKSFRRGARAAAALGSIVFAAAAVAPAACSVAVDLDGLSGGKPPAVLNDGGADSDAQIICVHDRWPDPPATAMEGGTDDFYAAIRSIDLGELNTTPEGFDLDGLCTCLPDGPSCTPPKFAAGDHCDGANGRDNGVTKIFQAIQQVVGEGGFGSSVFSAKAEKGQWSMLIRVRDYNGQADDTQVTVALYETYWDDAGKTKQPLWDGTDLWPVATTSLSDGVTIDSPVYVDAAAYVSGGVVVASLPESYLGLNSGGSTLGVRLTAGTLIGQIEKKNDRYRISEGIIGARWRAEDIFDVIGKFSIAGASLCNDPSSQAYARVKEVICDSIDIASKLGGATTPCDSISFGMKFATEPAGVDKTFIPEEQVSPCSSGTNPANDSCESL